MKAEFSKPVRYALRDADKQNDEVCLNNFLGKKISLSFTGKIFCLACNASLKKSYGNGYCYRCFTTLPECDSCIVKPELCHFHLGTCRDSEWGKAHCMQPHIVYVSYTSGVKVGITRKTQVPIRWIDQGAIKALPLFQVTSRLLAGQLEVLLKKEYQDKTQWKKMLENTECDVSLKEIRENIFQQDELEDFIFEFGEDSLEFLESEDEVEIEYPILEIPQKITSLNFLKHKNIEGTLLGIKGQYLLFDSGVINIRNHAGFQIELQY